VKAAVAPEFGKPLVIEEIDIAPPQAGELKVAMKACGICASDVHSIAGAWGGRFPAVFGHEAAGIIDEVGPDVHGFRVGQQVASGRAMNVISAREASRYSARPSASTRKARSRLTMAPRDNR